MNKPETNPETIAHLWTLICCLQTSRYCMRELSPTVPKNTHMARKMKELYKAIHIFLKHGQRHASASERELLESLSHDSVAAIAETVAILSHLPPSKIDWFCDRVNSMAKGVILSDHEKNERGDEK